jgi:DNA polymerase-3 subunit chi
MSEIVFYHLTELRLEQALPDLLEKCLARDWNVVVQTGTEERRDQLDDHLWTYKESSFLPHACEESVMGNPSNQPIWLTSLTENPNNAAVRFIVAGAVAPDLSSYERGIYMFDGHDEEAVLDARERWKIEKAAGHDLAYWQQQDGRWVKKA